MTHSLSGAEIGQLGRKARHVDLHRASLAEHHDVAAHAARIDRTSSQGDQLNDGVNLVVGTLYQAVPAEHLMDRVDREPDAVQSLELDPEPLDPKLALLAQLDDELLQGRKHPPSGRVQCASAAVDEAGLTLRLVASPPFTERWS